MSQITSIEPQIKDKNRCSIFVDGRFYCGIKLEVAVKYKLKVGMPVDKEYLDEIQFETEKSQAMDKALNHLSATMKTEKQIRDFLVKKGYVQTVCDYVIEKLRYYNFVDDNAYCRAYINGVSGKGKRAIEADLIKRGASRESIEEALSAYEEDGEEVLSVLKKYMRGKEVTKENLYKGNRYLLSRGYGYDAAKEACERLLNENDDN